MLSIKTTPVHSEYRHSVTKNHIGFQPYVLKEHITSASYQNNHTHFNNYHKRPHLQIRLDENLTIQALVDTGSSICIGDSSLIQHLKKKFPIASPVNVMDVHNTKRPTLGCFEATITVDDPLPYPIHNENINIHMTHNLSSKLILGTDFLQNHGAIIDVKSNNTIFLPNEYFPVSLCQKPIVCEAFSSIITNDSETKDLTHYNTAVFAVQPMEDVDILYTDQKTIHVQIITDNHRMTYKPGTMVMLTSGFAPFPQIPEGLYTIEENNTIQVTIKNSSTGTLTLLQNRPIPGIVAHDLKLGYHDPVEINKDILRALFLKDQTVEAAKMAGLLKEDNNTNTSQQLASDHPEYIDPTPEEYISSVSQQFEEASSLLQATGLEPPGSRTKPRQHPSFEVRTNLKSQFDASGIDKEWVTQYEQLIMENWDVFSLHKYDVGHTPHWEHKIEPTTNEPVYIKQFKIAVGDEAALDEMSTNLTAARILIQQPSDNNTPIFMVAKRGGPNPGKKRFDQDFRKRNAASKDDKYTIKDVRESLVAVGRLKPKIWSKLDFTGAFYCLSLEKESQKLTSFTLPFKNAQYSWARMPQGLKGASASFSKLCQIIFRHTKYHHIRG